MYVVDVVFLN